jgi:hypothetical protein
MGLTYSLMARQARADQMTHAVDQSLVNTLIAQSISRAADPRVGATLYELLVPHDLKQPIGTGSHLHLLLDETTADMPWELLTLGQSGQHLGELAYAVIVADQEDRGDGVGHGPEAGQQELLGGQVKTILQ